MSKVYLQTSVAFDERQAVQLNEACARRRTTRSALIRDAVDAFLGVKAAGAEDPVRVAMLREFTQVALDVLIREQAPERREEILATVQDRMERYHAQ